MSAQGGTLGRLGTSHLPIWPVATLLAAAIASAIALSTLGDTVDDRVVTPVTVQERFANSAASIREQGATIPLTRTSVWEAQADAYVDSLVARAPLTGSAIWKAQADAYVASLVAAAGGEGVVTHAVGLENPGAYGITQVTEATYPVGLENPGVYPAETDALKGGAHRPIEVNGTVCGQCR
jgi:hypothetical protein